jgi:hypothetical protein
MPVNLADFVNRVHSLYPSVINVFGTGLPGMSGTSVASQGANSSGADVVNKLRHEVSNFAELISNHGPEELIQQSADTIEGQLFTLQTLGQISEQLMMALIDDLHDLIKL